MSNRVKTQFDSILVSCHLRKNFCRIKRPDRDSNFQSQQVQLLLESIDEKKETFISRRLNHWATQCHNQLEKKAYSTFVPKDGGIVAKVDN